MQSSAYMQDNWKPPAALYTDPEIRDVALDLLPTLVDTEAYDRAAIYAPSTIFSRLIGDGAGSQTEKWDLAGVEMNVQLARVHAFRRNQSCVCCGITGTFFLLERHLHDAAGGYALTLYTTDHNGELVRLTVDHILPDSLGGRFATSNFQTMCSVCNSEKGHRITQAEIDKIRLSPRTYAKNWVDLELLEEVLQLRERWIAAEQSNDPGLEDIEKMYERYRKYVAFGVKKTRIVSATAELRAYLAPPQPPAPPPSLWQRVWSKVLQTCQNLKRKR